MITVPYMHLSNVAFLRLFSMVVLISLSLRWLYCLSHDHAPQRKEVTTFTGFRFLDRYMLLWPLLAGISAVFIKWDRRRVQTTETKRVFHLCLLRDFFSRWMLSYILFGVFFHMFANLSGTKQGDFDPSGHLTCGLLASACWLQLLNTCSQLNTFNRETMQAMLYVVFAAVSYHLFVIIHSVMVYHDTFESTTAFAFGLFIYLITFWADCFTDCITYSILHIPQLRHL